MINILIADDNINYAINLMNYINNCNNNLKVYNITKNGKETLKVLNNDKNIDIILMDYKMLYYKGEQILNKIIDKNRYDNSIIIISGLIENTIDLKKNKMVHSVIFKTMGLDEIVNQVNELCKYKECIGKQITYKKKDCK